MSREICVGAVTARAVAKFAAGPTKQCSDDSGGRTDWDQSEKRMKPSGVMWPAAAWSRKTKMS